MPTKAKLNWYLASVTDGTSSARILCQTYNVFGSSVRGGEFHIKTTSFPSHGLTIPSARQANFREELICTLTAAEIVADSLTEEDWIKGKLKEAFGSNVHVDVKVIE